MNAVIASTNAELLRLRKWPAVWVTLSEDEIGHAIAWLWTEHQLQAEGAGAVAAGAVRFGKVRSLPTPAAVVISGGNIDEGRFKELLERYAVSS